MNPFTGGCHYDNGCGKFADACGACPELGSRHEGDLSRQIWRRKCEALDRIPSSRLQIVADSHWLAEEASKSSLFAKFPVTFIHYGLDVNEFAPRDRRAARLALGLPTEASIILFAAAGVNNRRKGLSHLVEALAKLPACKSPVLVTMGAGELELPGSFSQLHLGSVVSERILSLIYSAADLFVMPSLQEAFGQTALESMACGTPVVAFRAGGLPEVVHDGLTGLTVPPGDSVRLREAIELLLNDVQLREEMSANCRRIVLERHTLEIQARNYDSLYRKISAKPQSNSGEAIPLL
jgi:glycosyltransferase involved in cell wall biosynthesis